MDLTRYENANMGSVDWKYSHLASDHRPGRDSTGFFLGGNIHWQLSQNNIVTGAQLVIIGNTDVSTWEYDTVKASLEQFLRDGSGPNERRLVFRNPPSKISNPIPRSPPTRNNNSSSSTTSSRDNRYVSPQSDYVHNAEEHVSPRIQLNNYYNKHKYNTSASPPVQQIRNLHRYDSYRRDDDSKRSSRSSIRSLPMGRGRGRGRGTAHLISSRESGINSAVPPPPQPSRVRGKVSHMGPLGSTGITSVAYRGRGASASRRRGRGRGTKQITGYTYRSPASSYAGSGAYENESYTSNNNNNNGYAAKKPYNSANSSSNNEIYNRVLSGLGRDPSRPATKSRGRSSRGRGRGHGGFIRQLARNNGGAPGSEASSIKSEDYTSNMSNMFEIQPILQQLAYPKKEYYRAKDVIWVESKDNRWNMCIVKYVLNDDELIVRPFGRSEMSEIKIAKHQIHGMPNFYSIGEFQKCLEQMKTELYNVYNIQRNEERDIFEGSLVKCRDTFGEVLSKHANGRYMVKIKSECRWYRGPEIIEQISRNQIEYADVSQMQCDILRDETRFMKVDKGQRVFQSDDEDSMEVYRFLGILGDFYINDFLENGFTKMCFVYQLKEEDLGTMNVKLGHIRFILSKIEEHNAKEERSKQSKHKESDDYKGKDERKKREKCKWVDFPSSDEETTPMKETNDLMNTSERVRENEADKEKTEANKEDTAIKLVVYGFDEIITSRQCNDDETEEKLLQIFGGKERIERLKKHFDILQAHNIEIAIISHDSQNNIHHKLDKINLFEAYFTNSTIIGAQSNELHTAMGSKAKCISNIWKTRYSQKEIIFVDVNKSDIEKAIELKVCNTLLVESKGGMNDKHMQRIENMMRIKDTNVNHDSSPRYRE